MQPDVDDALNFILDHLRREGPARWGSHGYDFVVADMVVAWRRAQGEARAASEEQGTYDLSPAFYDAAWELSRRGVLRASVRNSFMAWSAVRASGSGYTLTAVGASWLAARGGERLRLADRWGPFES